MNAHARSIPVHEANSNKLVCFAMPPSPTVFTSTEAQNAWATFWGKFRAKQSDAYKWLEASPYTLAFDWLTFDSENNRRFDADFEQDDFGAFLDDMNPDLPQPVVRVAMDQRSHVLLITQAVIDVLEDWAAEWLIENDFRNPRPNWIMWLYYHGDGAYDRASEAAEEVLGQKSDLEEHGLTIADVL